MGFAIMKEGPEWKEPLLKYTVLYRESDSGRLSIVLSRNMA